MSAPTDVPILGIRGSRRLRRQLGDPQTWRLVSGLVLFAFALTHFLNHALGHVSVEAMENVQLVRRAVWRSWPGTILLYGALGVHVSFALAKLARRRTWHMAPWEVVQIGLGLLIPLLGASHVAATRGVSSAAGFDDVYTVELRILWPGPALNQSVFLLVVWLHAMIGLHQWLRTKRWYARWNSALLIAAVLVPTLALTGWIEAARRVSLTIVGTPPMTEHMFDTRALLIDRTQKGVWAAFLIAAAIILIARMTDWFRTGPTISYSGGRTVRAKAGATLLEISRSAGIPHAAICGGRGRCTTCRVLILKGGDDLPPPNQKEAAALERINAPPGVRLACQVRPVHSVELRPLIPLRMAEPTAGQDTYRWGVERRITVLFADIRSFTSVAERLYPYDSVFLLNRFFELMSQAVERHGGEVDKFLGDGLMALFGISPAPGAGSRDAIFAARDMLQALDRLNVEFAQTLSEPLRMGIGIHAGPVVLGRVGGGQVGLTALGDTVNIASRLEAMNKELGSSVIISEVTLQASKCILDDGEIREVQVRGRAETLRAIVAKDLGGLEALSGEVDPADRPTVRHGKKGS